MWDEPNSAILIIPHPRLNSLHGAGGPKVLQFCAKEIKPRKAKQPVDDSIGARGHNLWPPNHTPPSTKLKKVWFPGLLSLSFICPFKTTTVSTARAVRTQVPPLKSCPCYKQHEDPGRMSVTSVECVSDLGIRQGRVEPYLHHFLARRPRTSYSAFLPSFSHT